ncbi:MAG: redoxin domain-containing protein [Rhizobacter sp.]|nr:redoxin domain-containing protein [Burkholderiaceae bacterium]MCO5124568.1 redoxin domain-containing protein [Rhizobacter sp.]
MPSGHPPAPPLVVQQWLNTEAPITLDALRGRVVMLHAFQMLCPGCVSHGLPQAAKAHEMFRRSDLAVIGLHTVFEHHAVTGAEALKAFVHEYRLQFPIGIDTPGAGSGPIPLTMQAYELGGTPSVVLIDRQGRVRLNQLGRVDDLALGALIGELIAEGDARSRRPAGAATRTDSDVADGSAACDGDACTA